MTLTALARLGTTALLVALAVGAFAVVPVERARRRDLWARWPHVTARVAGYVTGRHAGGRNGIDYRARRYAYELRGQAAEAQGPDIQQALWFDESAPPVGASVELAVSPDDPARAVAEADIDAVQDRVVPNLVGVLLLIAAAYSGWRALR